MTTQTLAPNQVYEFLDLGYLTLGLHDAALGTDFAKRMFARARKAYIKFDLETVQRHRLRHIADETVDCMPDVNRLLSSRELNGALTSLLGEISTDIGTRLFTERIDTISRFTRIRPYLGEQKAEFAPTNLNGQWCSTIRKTPLWSWVPPKSCLVRNIGT